jgi:3-hydroxybutyryl-CoA dehydrogenase
MEKEEQMETEFVVSKIGVVGAGQMGNGIAQVAALSGFDVVLLDAFPAALEKGMATLRKNLARQVAKNVITQDQADAATARIQPSSDMRDLADVDLAIEAATENVNLKFKIFEDLSSIVKAGAILATNTSSISITAIAAHTNRPERTIGMHFMNPVPLMRLCEIIRGLATSDETNRIALEVAARMGKTTVESRDMPGFIVNRVLMPYINEAFRALQEGIASPQDIDQAMKLGTNVPMGPLQLADFIGLDTVRAILDVLYQGLGNDSYAPCPLLVKYVEAGWLGVKSGRGVFTYAK